MASVEELLDLHNKWNSTSINFDDSYDDVCGYLFLSRAFCDGLFFLVLTILQVRCRKQGTTPVSCTPPSHVIYLHVYS